MVQEDGRRDVGAGSSIPDPAGDIRPSCGKQSGVGLSAATEPAGFTADTVIAEDALALLERG